LTLTSSLSLQDVKAASDWPIGHHGHYLRDCKM
jgi:hypothetical protein